jgi:ubiquinone/menaquinone biosynthesis C-methylase UbiE
VAQTNSFSYRTHTYGDVASEYYDPQRHPTCANFREASDHIIWSWLREILTSDVAVLETGAGRSTVAEWLAKHPLDLRAFFATDIALEMLGYTCATSRRPPILCVCDAEALPFAANSFQVVVSSLADPYNTPVFWRELSRVVRTSGYVLFTTPSFNWAHEYRNGVSFAEFATEDGQLITVPSFIESSRVQQRMMELAGFVVDDHIDFHEQQVQHTLRSPKLRPGVLVSGFLLRKR